MTDLEIAIERVLAAANEMERAIAALREARTTTIQEQDARGRAHNRARRSVA